jgi:hypothetical protein
MNTRYSTHPRFLISFGVAVLAFFSSLFTLSAADQQFRAVLIWATDEPKPDKENVKDLESKLSEKLRRVFKWKNYFQTASKTFTLPATSSPNRVKMSPKCEIEIMRLDATNMQVKLFGEGKLVKTLKQPIKPLLQKEYSIVGGDDKEHYNDAWLVVISLEEPE